MVGLEAEEVPVIERLRAAGVRVALIPVPGRDYLRERRDVARAIREIGADVVHTHGIHADVIHSSAARSVGVPTVMTFHGFTNRGLKGRAYEAMARLSARRSQGIVAVSPAIARDLRAWGVPEDRLRLIPNRAPEVVRLSADEARAELGLPPDRLRLAWMGRIFPEKGLDVLVEALLGLDLPTHLTVFGEGPDRARLEERAAGRTEIAWQGYVAEAARYLPAFDGFVLSSRTEGWPLTLLEAMEAGTPVVATRVGGVPDIVGPDQALLVPSEDPDALAAAIRRLAEDPDGASRRAASARARVGEVRPADWVGAYLDVYDDAIARARR